MIQGRAAEGRGEWRNKLDRTAHWTSAGTRDAAHFFSRGKRRTGTASGKKAPRGVRDVPLQGRPDPPAGGRGRASGLVVYGPPARCAAVGLHRLPGHPNLFGHGTEIYFSNRRPGGQARGTRGTGRARAARRRAWRGRQLPVWTRGQGRLGQRGVACGKNKDDEEARAGGVRHGSAACRAQRHGGARQTGPGRRPQDKGGRPGPGETTRRRDEAPRYE